MSSPPDFAATERALQRVRARCAAARDEAGFPLTRHRAGPFRLRQMLPRDAVLLYATGNPVFAGRPAWRCPINDIANFVFVLTAPPPDGARAHRVWHAWVLMRLILVRLRRRAWWRLVRALDDYVFRTFVDAPASEGGESGGGGARAVHGSFLSTLYDALAARYNWSLAEMDATPLRRLLLHQKHTIVALYRDAKQKPPPESNPHELALLRDYQRQVDVWRESGRSGKREAGSENTRN